MNAGDKYNSLTPEETKIYDERFWNEVDWVRYHNEAYNSESDALEILAARMEAALDEIINQRNDGRGKLQEMG